MQLNQLKKFLNSGLRNLSEPPSSMIIGSTVFCTAYLSVLTKVNKESPFWTCVLAKQLNSEKETIFLVQDAEGDSHWIHASYFWTKEQVLRLLVCGPKGKKGIRKYNRHANKLNH